MDTSDALTLALGAYGALLASLVAVFQIVSTRTRMKVVPARMYTYTAAPPGVAGPPPEEVVLVTMTNYSDHHVRVTGISFNQKGKWFALARPYPVEEPLPILIEPRDAKMVWTHPHQLQDSLDLSGKVKVSISTSNNRHFSSGRVYLEPWTRWNWRRPWRRPRQIEES